MKAKLAKTKKFEPVEITITLESLDEVGKFYALCNHTSITRAVSLDGELTKIRKVLRDTCKDIPYSKYHSNLCNTVK